jgi:type IV pilus assembly protein PilB
MTVVNLVPKQVLQKHRCLPVIKNDRTLIVAMLDPNDPFAIDDLRAATGLQIQAVAVPVQELMPVLQQVLQARS